MILVEEEIRSISWDGAHGSIEKTFEVNKTRDVKTIDGDRWLIVFDGFSPLEFTTKFYRLFLARGARNRWFPRRISPEKIIVRTFFRKAARVRGCTPNSTRT